MNTYSNAFIFHGTAGSPDGNWFPWLKQEFEKQGIPTTVPRFPTPQGESLTAWMAILNAETQKIGPNSLVIGHSKGGMFLLKVLEGLKQPVKTAIFVSTPVGVKPIFYYEEDKKFTNFEFDWTKIRDSAKQFIVFHSDTSDPYVSLANGKRLAKELGVKLNVIPNGGHLNAESGFTTFEPLLEKVLT